MEFLVGFCRARLFNDEMQPKSDAQLLRQYAERGDESAFAEIVTRHAGLVYSAALRQVDAPDLARDITQNVFTDLARKARSVAGKLSEHSSRRAAPSIPREAGYGTIDADSRCGAGVGSPSSAAR